MDKPDELLLTPASLLLPAQASEVIRFFYKGPADEKSATTALSGLIRPSVMRSAIMPTAALWPLLPPASAPFWSSPPPGELPLSVRQRLPDKYRKCDAADLAYGPCLKAANGKECKENYYLMPGKSRRFTRVDTADNKGRVALWQGDKFIPVK